MLTLNHISKSFHGKKALDGVTVDFPPGQIVGLFGENGAGKTTLMKCILGFLPHKGAVTLDGEPISRKNIARLSFATSEHSFFPALTPDAHRDFYDAHFESFNHKRYNGLMEFFELPSNKMLRSFSTGQKNQFEVIMAMSQGASYILMDEPFSGNDLFNREDFYKVLLGILEPRETVILSTHLIEEVAQFISRAVLIRKGVIVGDVDTLALEEETNLVDYVKQTYHYQADRVSRALELLGGGEEGMEP